MLVRGFAAESFGDGGSAFTKNCRPSSFRTLAICAFAPFAKKDAKKIAQKASVVLISPAVIAVRLVIPLARSTVTPVWPGSCLGEGDNNLGTYYTADSFQHWRFIVNVPSVLGPHPSGLPKGRSPGGGSSCYVLLGQGVGRLIAAPVNVSRKTRFWRNPIITRALVGRGCSIGHFLGQLCLWRQPLQGQAFPPLNRLAVWPAPVSACQHGL